MLQNKMQKPPKGKVLSGRPGCPKTCVNPAHAVLTTRKEVNVRLASNPTDAMILASIINGENGRARLAKITAETAAVIRDSVGSQAEIAARYGISKSLVGLIKRGQCWRTNKPLAANASVFSWKGAA